MSYDTRHMNATAESRARAAETIARVDALLALPRPQGEPWEVPQDLRRNDGGRPQPKAAVAHPSAAAAHPVSRAWGDWTNRRIGRAFDVLEAAVGRAIGKERLSARLRFAEIERRLAELEKERPK